MHRHNLSGDMCLCNITDNGFAIPRTFTNEQNITCMCNLTRCFSPTIHKYLRVNDITGSGYVGDTLSGTVILIRRKICSGQQCNCAFEPNPAPLGGYLKGQFIVDTTLHSVQLLIMRIIPSENDRFVLVLFDFAFLDEPEQSRVSRRRSGRSSHCITTRA